MLGGQYFEERRHIFKTDTKFIEQPSSKTAPNKSKNTDAKFDKRVHKHQKTLTQNSKNDKARSIKQPRSIKS